ncbi:S24 family peptidase [Catonella massiliensis]|nr:S24 family peptidase [Catonella massiliensis]
MKKFRSSKKGAYLVSLNKNYAPMPVTENSSFKIFGRVLAG